MTPFDLAKERENQAILDLIVKSEVNYSMAVFPKYTEE